eukprot:CAMPEP_0114537544 /NCGR_PEP_ID=MMETSP0109-20121206/29637_1 /TAXON_ID=29199 /ORGANISM="Chlorarachnion reptans, Strain CCCM449" /LENGTH=660 /DNA_ID=CAMNT_0001721445 /DNA_START=330 /DNA_END=2308 /DNA_ORIENTATION=+
MRSRQLESRLSLVPRTGIHPCGSAFQERPNRDIALRGGRKSLVMISAVVMGMGTRLASTPLLFKGRPAVLFMCAAAGPGLFQRRRVGGKRGARARARARRAGLLGGRAEVALQQPLGGGVEPFDRPLPAAPRRAGGRQLLPHPPRELLAQLHAELVERVHAPDEALHGHPVLVQREELAGREGVHGAVEEEDRRGAVPGHQAVGDQRLGDPLRAELRRRDPDRQGVRLGEEVGHQLVVVGDGLAGEADRGLAPREADEVDGDGAALVQELEEGVLGVRPGLAELHHLGRRARERGPVGRHALPVGLHRELLDVRGELGQGAGVGDQRAGAVPLEGALPDGEEAEEDREVRVERGCEEVAVDVPRAGEEGAGDRHPELQREGEDAGGGAHRVPPAHPVPEPEDVPRGDPEALGPLRVGADGHHVVPDRPLAHAPHEPAPHGPGVEERLGRGERLRDDDDQGLLRVPSPDARVGVDRVDVRQEPQLPSPPVADAFGRGGLCLWVVRQGRGHEVGAEVAPADPDHEDVKEASPGVAAEGPGPHALGEVLDVGEDLVDQRDDVDPVGPAREQEAVRRVCPQRHVQRRAALRRVDRLAPGHRLDPLLQPRGPREPDEHPLRLERHPLPREVGEHPVRRSASSSRRCGNPEAAWASSEDHSGVSRA